MRYVLIPVFFLSLFSIFNIFGIKPNLVGNQILYFVIAGLLYIIIKKIGNNIFYQNVKLLYFLFLGILIITFIIGLEVKGSKRWIDLYFFNFQASEFFKIFFILFLSDYLSKKQLNFFSFIKSIIYFIIPAVIIFKQPDLGNTMVLVFVFIVLILFSSIKKKYLIYFLLAIFSVIPLGFTLLHNYQKARIFSFLNPEFDQQGTAYNMIQSVITVGSGKFLGRGLGLGTQSRLFFLPENHTDFAFASLVEQFGFVGGGLVIICYIIIFIILAKRLVALFYDKESDLKKAFLYTLGFTSYFTFQVIINIGMNLGIMPITGIALPIISYGGSSIVAAMIGLAFITDK